MDNCNYADMLHSYIVCILLKLLWNTVTFLLLHIVYSFVQATLFEYSYNMNNPRQHDVENHHKKTSYETSLRLL